MNIAKAFFSSFSSVINKIRDLKSLEINRSSGSVSAVFTIRKAVATLESSTL